MSRQSTPDQLQGNFSSPGSSPIEQGDLSEHPSMSSRRRMSKDSEGYPSWLPRRPTPPVPVSNFQSSLGLPESPLDPSSSFIGGRKPTPRSVRIVSVQDPPHESLDQTQVINNPRVRNQATGASVSPAVLSNAPDAPRTPQPRFHSRNANLDLLRNPTLKFRLYFYLYPLLIFAHIPLQTFFDFNAVYILIQVSKFPDPQAPGIPGSGRNWALGAAAYIACWFAWIIIVFVIYELVYSFIRKWRVKRPFVIPIYLSSSSFKLVAMTSYTNFCFLQHIRLSAFFGENGSIRNGLAETFWFYSQNLPTVALLLPRAGLVLALLLAFSTPQAGEITLIDAGVHLRDSTFFRTTDGTLTKYARGVLIANAAWTAWRALVLIGSWIGLWIISEQGCAGLCGPRYRWEEEEAEKTRSYYSEDVSFDDTIPWSWREYTRMRIHDAYDFCLTIRPSSRRKHQKEVSERTPFGANRDGELSDGVEQVLAAIALPSVPPPARRGVLSDEFFEGPSDKTSAPPTDTSAATPKVVKRSSKEKQVAGPSTPLPSLSYPFTSAGACMSSSDKVPFPPSPVPSGSKPTAGRSDGTGSGSESRSSDVSADDDEEEEEDEEDEEEEEEEEEDEEEDEDEDESEEPSTGRGSTGRGSTGRGSESMSSLGQPVSSRYPFHYRRPGNGTSVSSGAASHQTPTSQSRSMLSKASQGTQSTGNRESSDSHSPRSQYSTSDAAISSGGRIPMPPRHPQQGQRGGRKRAGTVPAVAPVVSTPLIVFPTSRPKNTTRGDTDSLGGLGSDEGHSLDDDAVSVESHEAAEREDLVGLLSSPAPSLRNRKSTSSQNRFHGSRSRSNSRSNSHTSSSRSRVPSFSRSIRSRAQSLMQNIGAASHSSLELVQVAIRSRANSSMARLEEDPYHSDQRTHSRSGSGSVSANENYTFGQPMRMHFPMRDQERVEEEPAIPQPESQSRPHTPPPLHHSLSNLSFAGPSRPPRPSSQSPSQFQQEPSSDSDWGAATASAWSTSEGDLVIPAPSSPVEISRRPLHEAQRGHPTDSAKSSPPDISTAPESFVTAPATIEGTTESSGRTISSWGDLSHMVDRPDTTWRPA